jgi:hypothetical protein
MRRTLLVPILLLGLASGTHLPVGPLPPQVATRGAAQPELDTLFTTRVAAADSPATTRHLFMWYAIVGRGVRTTSHEQPVGCCPGLRFTHVLSGTLSLQVDGPLSVIHDAALEHGARSETILPKTEVVLHPGDIAVYAEDLAATLGNPGRVSVHLVGVQLLSRPAPPLSPEDFVAPRPGFVPAPFLPAGPVVITLQQAELAPGAILPAPLTGDFRMVMTGLDLAPLVTGRDGAVQNGGQQSVVVYAVTLHPIGSESG